MANIIQVLQMCRAFQKIGVDVTLALPALGKNVSQETITRHIHEKIGVYPSFRVVSFNYPSLRGFAKGLGASIGAASLIKQAHRYDIIFTRSLFFAGKALKMGHKVVYESHGARLNNRSRMVDLLYRSMLLKAVCQQNLLLFITISRALSKIWRQRGVPESKVLPLHDCVAADDYQTALSRQEARSKLNLAKGHKLVVYAGSLYRNRGIESILKLAKALHPAIFYVIGGPKENKNCYASKARRKGIDNIVFVGHVPHRCVKDYLFAADVLLMLWSREVPTIDICSPLKIFEYMAVGRIIVGHGFRTIKEVLKDGETAFLTDPGSYPELETKMRVALTKEYPCKMAEKARKLALSRYSWEKRAGAIIDALNHTGAMAVPPQTDRLAK